MPNPSFLPSNEYNPLHTTVPAPPEDTGGFAGGVADSYRMGWMGQVWGAVEREAAGLHQVDPDFDASKHVPEGYESFKDFFLDATSMPEILLRKRQIDSNIAARKRRDARGGWATLGYDALAGIVDPLNIIAPELAGAGFLAGAAKGAATIGAAGAVAEAVRGASDPTSSREETVAGMLSSTALGGAIGGVVGHLTRGVASAPSVATTRTVRPVIDVNNEAAKRSIFRSVTLQKESSGGQNLVGTPTFDGVKTVQAMGAAQVTADTGKAMAKKLGLKWEPERLKSHKPEDIAYQEQLGFAYFDEAVRASHGDLETAFKYYYGGPNRKYWGPKTEQYAAESMAMLGYSSGAEGLVRPANVAGVLAAIEGMERPSHVEVDGRWLPVVDGPLPNGGLAARVPAKSASEMLGEAMEEAARSESGGVGAIGRGPAPSIFDGLERLHANEIKDLAKSWDRRAHEDPAFAEELRSHIASGKDPDVGMLEQLIEDKRIEALRAEMQRKADAGEIFTRPGKAAGEGSEALAGQPSRSLIQRKLKALEARYSALEARILKNDSAMLPKETRKPTGKEIADGARPTDRIVTKWEKVTTAANRLAKQMRDYQRQLDELGGAEDPDLEIGELFAGSRLSAEGDAFVASRPFDDNGDDALAELRRLDSRKREMDMDSGELADELPFGMDHDGSSYFAADGEHIRIDSQAIFRSFKEKPWTSPRMEGVTPFPEDAFRTPDEWLAFVVDHEREHSVNPRQEGESLADYENRINAQAYERTVAQRSGGVAGSRLRRLALAGTPLAALERLVKDKDATIHRSMQLLASDMAVQLAANRLGYTPLRGGSVMQRVERWRVRPLTELQDAMRRGYLEDLGLSGEGTRTEIGARVLAQGGRNLAAKVTGNARKSLAEFKEEVAAAYIGFEGEVGGRPIVAGEAAKKVAAKLKELDDEFEREARSVNLFNKTKELTRLKEAAEKNAASLRNRAERLRSLGKEAEAKELDDVAAGAEARAQDYARKLDEPIMQPGEKQHYHRIYDVGALKADRDGAVEALENAYRRNHHQSPRLAAEAAYDQLVMDPTGDIMGPGTAAGLKRLELPWTNAEAFKYIVRDPELAFGIYARQMGSAIEMTRSFGDAYALDHIDALRADLAERGVAKAKIERAVQLFEDARDHIVGGFHRRDPLAWDYRAARGLKNLTNLAVLGKAVYSQVADIARVIGVQGLGIKRLVTGEGPAGLIGGLMSAFAGDIGRFNPGGIAKLSGEAGELVTARLAALMMDSDAAVLALRDNAIERQIAKAQVPFFMLNLMTPWTIFWKEMTGLTAAHTIIDEAHAVAAHVKAGGTIDTAPKALRAKYERLAQRGIDAQMAQLLSEMPTEKGAGGLHLPNVLAWEGERGHEARQALLAAVNGEIRLSVPTPGVLERPRVFDGTFFSARGKAQQQEKVDALKAQLAATTDKDEAQMVRVELEAARREMGRAGRVQLPLLSLPFQLHAFAMTAGAKTLHGLFTSSERLKIGGFLSLWLAGMTVAYLKAHDPIGGLTTSSRKQRKQAYAWDKMTWGEFAWNSFEYSNLGAIFTDVGKNVTNVARGFGHDPSLGMVPEYDPSDSSLTDEIGSSLGVGPALVAGLVEPFVSDDHRPTADAIRRVLPYNNVIWWKGAVDRITDALRGEDMTLEAAAVPAPGEASIPGRTGDHAFFAPDPETMLELDMAAPPEGSVAIRPGAPITNLPAALQPQASRRARRVKPNLFGAGSAPAPATAAPVAGGKRIKRIKPNLFGG